MVHGLVHGAILFAAVLQLLVEVPNVVQVLVCEAVGRIGRWLARRDRAIGECCRQQRLAGPLHSHQSFQDAPAKTALPHGVQSGGKGYGWGTIFVLMQCAYPGNDVLGIAGGKTVQQRGNLGIIQFLPSLDGGDILGERDDSGEAGLETVKGMTQLLEQAMGEVQKLPDAGQDAIGAIILEEIAYDRRWDDAFARSQDQLGRLANRVREDIRAGKVKNVGIDEL
ncbi:MAG: hypothetical protein ACLQNE_01315 [Thermoguttaceae bacterium]